MQRMTQLTNRYMFVNGLSKAKARKKAIERIEFERSMADCTTLEKLDKLVKLIDNL